MSSTARSICSCRKGQPCSANKIQQSTWTKPRNIPSIWSGVMYWILGQAYRRSWRNWIVREEESSSDKWVRSPSSKWVARKTIARAVSYDNVWLPGKDWIDWRRRAMAASKDGKPFVGFVVFWVCCWGHWFFFVFSLCAVVCLGVFGTSFPLSNFGVPGLLEGYVSSALFGLGPASLISMIDQLFCAVCASDTTSNCLDQR